MFNHADYIIVNGIKSFLNAHFPIFLSNEVAPLMLISYIVLCAVRLYYPKDTNKKY